MANLPSKDKPYEIVLRDNSHMIPRAYFKTQQEAQKQAETLNKKRISEPMFIGFKVVEHKF